MIDEIVKLKDFVPLFQSSLWVIFISVCLLVFRKPIKSIIISLQKRIASGSLLKFGNVEIGALIEKIPSVDKEGKYQITDGSVSDKNEQYRQSIYTKNRGVFISHLLFPSKEKGQKYDILIYLIRHKEQTLSDIKDVEFFFGHKWGNKIFKAVKEKDFYGIKTSAYGPFLCLCFITFDDGQKITLERYIDFEQEQYIK